MYRKPNKGGLKRKEYLNKICTFTRFKHSTTIVNESMKNIQFVACIFIVTDVKSIRR